MANMKQGRTLRRKPNIRMGQAKWIILFVILLCILIPVIVHSSSSKKEEKLVAEGVAYLNKIDSDKALEKAEAKIKEQRADAMTKLITDAANGEDTSFDPWSYFSDSVIMGDSRAVGFKVFEFLPDSRVFADAGNTIMTIEDSLDDLKNLNPSFVFLCYGLNDVTSARWESADAWVADFDAQIKKLQEMLPDTTVVVNSILPTTDKALSTSKRVKLIPDYETAIRNYCQQNSILFVDCDNVASNHMDMVDIDGIHYMKTFYPYWAAEMIMTAYIGNDTDAFGESDETTEAVEY